MVFFGEFGVSFTGASRIVLPKKIRELLKGGSFMLTKGFDACLAGFDREDWEQRAQELLGVSLLDREQLEKRRFLFSSATQVEIDEQGRFVVPKNLVQYAHLDNKKAMVVGVGDHFEIWNEHNWYSYLEKSFQ